MSEYTEKIDKHAVHTSVINVQDELMQLENIGEKTVADSETIARISMVIKNFTVALETCDKNLIAIAWLDEVTNSLNSLKSSLANYRNTRSSTYLISNASGQLETILRNTVRLNCVRSRQHFKGLADAVGEYTKVMDLHNEQLQEKVDVLAEEIASISKNNTDEHNRCQKSIVEFQKTISDEKQRLDNFATSYQNQMATDKDSFISMIAVLKETFANSQEERKKLFEIEIEEAKKQRQTSLEKAELQKEEIKRDGNDLIEEYRNKFEEYKEQVVNIVGIVNTNMFSHKYKQVADDSHKSARCWHALAVILMLAVGAFAVYAFVITVKEDTNWVKLVAKIFATTTLVTGSAYAARQASKQEKVERYARKIEMELVAIDPFIESINDEEKTAIKKELAMRLFGNDNAMEIGSNDESYVAMDKLSSIEELLKTVINLIGNFAK